jgi:hypothetical protein
MLLMLDTAKPYGAKIRLAHMEVAHDVLRLLQATFDVVARKVHASRVEVQPEAWVVDLADQVDSMLRACDPVTIVLRRIWLDAKRDVMAQR